MFLFNQRNFYSIIIFSFILFFSFQNCSKFNVSDLSTKNQIEQNNPAVAPNKPPVEEILEDPNLAIKVQSFFSKSTSGNGYEIVSTMYAESNDSSENYSQCVDSKSQNELHQIHQIWDQGQYSNCLENHEPQCLKGSYRIVSALSYNSKLHQLQRFYACILPSQKTSTVYKATVYKHFDSKVGQWSCVSSLGSSNYWDLGGYSNCSQNNEVQCLQGTLPLVTSVVSMNDGITKFAVACVLPHQSVGSKIVASVKSGTVAGGASNWCQLPTLSTGTHFDENKFSLCSSSGIPSCTDGAKKIMKAGVVSADGALSYQSICLLPESKSQTNIVASMSGYSNSDSEIACGNIHWDLHHFVKCENGFMKCNNGSQRIIQGQTNIEGQVWTEASCIMNESLSSTSKMNLDFNDGKTAIVFAHQDDDLLWMQPFWNYANNFTVAAYEVPAAYDPVLQSYPEYLRSIWNPAWGRTTDSKFANFWLNACERYGTVTLENIKEKIRPIISHGLVRRIVTHNPWGEYGHLHHRLVSQAVRELATEYKKDVWVLSSKVQAAASGNVVGTYTSLGNFGFESVQGEFMHTDLKRIRSTYQAHGLSVPIPGVNSWNTWTWGTQEYDYPSGNQTFIKIVDQGLDLSLTQANIQSLISSVPVTGKCNP